MFSNIAELIKSDPPPVGIGDVSWTKKGDLTPNSDFNNYRIAGSYYTSGNGVVATMANRPSQFAGTLLVIPILSNHTKNGETVSGQWQYMIQVYITYQGGVYTRAMSTDSSESWTYGTWNTLVNT